MVPDYLDSRHLLYHSGCAEPGAIRDQNEEINLWKKFWPQKIFIGGCKVKCFLYAEVEHCLVYSLFIMLCINCL